VQRASSVSFSVGSLASKGKHMIGSMIADFALYLFAGLACCGVVCAIASWISFVGGKGRE